MDTFRTWRSPSGKDGGGAHNKAFESDAANHAAPQGQRWVTEEMNESVLLTALARFISELERLSGSTHEAEDRPLYGTLLAKAAILMAKVVRDEPIGDDVASMERLFGHTWFKDRDAYTKIYTEWDTFKRLLTQSIHGMTVNERLFNLGLLEEFDEAAAKGDEHSLRRILFNCLLDEKTIEAIIRQHLDKNE